MEDINELCELFQTTMTSLASDASHLQQVLHVEQSLHDPQVRQGLADLEAAITSVEKKVRILQEISAEEHRALHQMEHLKKAGEAQSEILEDMIRKVEATNSEKENNTTAVTPRVMKNQTNEYHSRLQRTTGKTTPKRRRDSVDPRTAARRGSRSPASVTPAIDAHTIHFEPVTLDELHGVSKTVRGRITLAVVNDALRDIERVVRHKYFVLHHGYKISEYRKCFNAHRELETEEHGGLPWVSEYDMRHSCAFFRSGESTARAILAILRSVRRLKQVPSRKSEVTYVCLCSGQ